ncbi:hypothetical protein [Methylomonas sp. AM2-LC]|uniref:hypothetical protein n=1 Tax=Methylomonas sp. AM2-LC TaxID=3153301 RepID=UPI003266BA95
MKKFNKTPLVSAMGTMVISGFAANVTADSNPFSMTELSNGYMQVAADTANKVNEGGCGANGKTAANTVKKAEGACGEGKCGGMMNNGKMKAGMESTCGAMMKGKEGSCGAMDANKAADNKKSTEMSCGAMMKGHEGSCGAAVDAKKAAGK